MSGLNTFAIDAAVVCLRVMRRLLQDEEITLAQLNYLVENIHDPLAQACLPPGQLPIVPALPRSSTSSNSHASTLARQHCTNSFARTPAPPASENDKKLKLRQSPQPAVIAPPGGTKPSNTFSSATSKHNPSPISREVSAELPAPQVPLTFSQYWDLFANLPTLYAVQMTLVNQLEGIIQRLLLMVDELQPSRDTADLALPLPDDAALGHYNNLSGASSPDNHAAIGSSHGSGSSRKHVSALRFPTPISIPGSRGVSGEIGVMVNEFFGSELMKHYMAEHMMYTVKFTQRAAPQLLRLSRVWRWTGGADTSGVSAAALASLCDADRTMLLQYSLFLDFLWRSFGCKGTPQDSRVFMPSSLESTSVIGRLHTSMGTADPSVTPGANTNSNNNNNGQRRARTATTATTWNAVGYTASGASKSVLPPIPVMWEGFHTILALLATPLGGLRRYAHVARCLVESGALQPKDRDRLQESFIDVVALRMSEEANLVMEELWTHDTASIMALMDAPGRRSTGDRAGGQANMRRVGTGGAGAAGAGGVGLHNGHTIAQESVAGTGGVAAAAMLSPTAAAFPVSAAVGIGGVNNMAPMDCSSRALIHYGRLSKRFGRGRHERLTFLFSDWMCYVEECSNGRFRVRGTIPLPGLRVVEVRDEEATDATYGFELLSPNLPKRLIFYTSSPEQRVQWVDAIRYTVRRFNERYHPQRQKASCTGTTNSSAANSSATAPAVTIGETGVPSVARATAPMLSAQSRLSLQRRYDRAWQDFVDAQRRMAEVPVQTSPTLACVSSASLSGVTGACTGGGGIGSAASAGHSPLLANLSGDLSRNSSFAGQRSSSTHRQLEYDVTPWSQGASAHRRNRSQDLLAVHQQQQQQSTASSSHTASSTPSVCTRLNANLSPGPEEVEVTLVTPAGDSSVKDAAALEEVTSLPGLVEDEHGAGPLSIAPLLFSSGGLHGKSFEWSPNSPFRPALLETLSSTSPRLGGGGLGASLRRPVSERFEAVKSVSNSNQVGSPTQPQSSQVRRSRNSSLNAPSSSPNRSASAGAADAGATRTAVPLPSTSGVTLSSTSRAEETNGETKAAAEAENTVEEEKGSVSPPDEPVAAEQVFLEDATTELSAPLDGEEQQLESETVSDVRRVEKGRRKKLPRAGCTADPQQLYRDVLSDFTKQQAEDEDEEEELSSEDSSSGSNIPREEKVGGDRDVAADSEPYDEDLHDLDEDDAASQHATDTSLAAPASMSPLVNSERAPASAAGNRVTGEEVNVNDDPDRLKTAVPLDKMTEDEDTTTAVVTAFRRNSSPARSEL